MVAVVLPLIVLPPRSTVRLMLNAPGLTGSSPLRGGRYTVDMQLFNSISCVSEATSLIFPCARTGQRCCGCGHGGRVCFSGGWGWCPENLPAGWRRSGGAGAARFQQLPGMSVHQLWFYSCLDMLLTLADNS